MGRFAEIAIGVFLGLVAAILRIYPELFFGRSRSARGGDVRIPVIWRLERLFTILAVVLIAALYVPRLLGFPMDFRHPWTQWLLTMMGTAVAARIVAGIILRRKWRRRVSAFDYEVCPNCGYPLKGLPSRHKCPECGQAYDLYLVKRKWYCGLKRDA